MKAASGAILLALLLSACGATQPTPQVSATPTPAQAMVGCTEPTIPPEAPVYAFFSCADGEPSDVKPVARQAQAADPLSRLDAAMIALVGGPTEGERAAGYISWFSEETELAFNSVTLDDDGLAIVDLADIRQVIPNASTSAGSEMLLAQLNATAFQIDEVTAVEYRIDGSCDDFWEWVQRSCEVVRRP